MTTGWAETKTFLQQLRAAPWTLTAIDPNNGAITTETVTLAQARAFVAKHNGLKNCYYSVNPVRGVISKKTAKTDIAAVQYVLADCDPREDESPDAGKERYLPALKQYSP